MPLPNVSTLPTDSRVILLEHINLSTQEDGDAANSTNRFYLDVLGCARDPRVKWMVHANIGLSQFHILPNQPVSQRLDGEIGLFYPSLDEFEAHLVSRAYPYVSTLCSSRHRAVPSTIRAWDFANATSKYDHLQVTCPNGNTFQCFQSPLDYCDVVGAIGAQPGQRALGVGMPYIKILVRPGVAAGIARFYETFLGVACVVTSTDAQAVVCVVDCGATQRLVFEQVQDEAQLRPYDGHHICIYIAEFEAAYSRLHGRHLTWNNPLFEDRCDTWQNTQTHQQFRIRSIVDPESCTVLLELEHEIRPVDHSRCPLFANSNHHLVD
ncbi:hypothetical protein DYB34_004565 [Aphanomyces astaci]|uniref:VOC domain-containing protein n=1 Tax=Aphanomyces astaci TaxID=112090 RepID=A0A418B763_APHAT|nr:hypothetical protein DYB34_004565 [Aphanomyces astaci]